VPRRWSGRFYFWAHLAIVRRSQFAVHNQKKKLKEDIEELSFREPNHEKQKS